MLPFPDLTREEARARLGIPTEVWMLLYVGRMAPEKNVHLLLQAMPHIHRGCPQAQLWLVGPGPALESLKAQAEIAGDSANRAFYRTPPPVPRDEVSLYLLRATCSCSPP
ncbi:MAG: hypothetical protein KatS3mg021_1431 [Fimbriimonadales bacterium]|nr:MAG: hypothetical protein KatS3mg021_1431 [Fimbriimonadales bacterium]